MESLNAIENVDCFVSGIITPCVGSGNRSAALRGPAGLERVVAIRNLTLFEHWEIVSTREQLVQFSHKNWFVTFYPKKHMICPPVEEETFSSRM